MLNMLNFFFNRIFFNATGVNTNHWKAIFREFIAKSLNASESRYSTVEVQNLGKAQPLWKLHGEAGLQRRSNATTTLDQPKLVLNAAAARQFRQPKERGQYVLLGGGKAATELAVEEGDSSVYGMLGDCYTDLAELGEASGSPDKQRIRGGTPVACSLPRVRGSARAILLEMAMALDSHNPIRTWCGV